MQSRQHLTCCVLTLPRTLSERRTRLSTWRTYAAQGREWSPFRFAARLRIPSAATTRVRNVLPTCCHERCDLVSIDAKFRGRRAGGQPTLPTVITTDSRVSSPC